MSINGSKYGYNWLIAYIGIGNYRFHSKSRAWFFEYEATSSHGIYEDLFESLLDLGFNSID